MTLKRVFVTYKADENLDIMHSPETEEGRKITFLKRTPVHGVSGTLTHRYTNELTLHTTYDLFRD
jgi:hypothetical protein